MTSHPSEPNPEDRPSGERRITPEEITANVLWPLVNITWGGDWTKESVVGYPFSMPKAGFHDGRMLVVSLEAEPGYIKHTSDEDEDADGRAPATYLPHLVRLTTEEPQTELLDDFLDRALETNSYALAYLFNPERMFRTESLMAIEQSRYIADTSGFWQTGTRQAIKDMDPSMSGHIVWSSMPMRGRSSSPDEQPDITEFDLDNMLAAAAILGVPPVVEYIEDLKAQLARP